MININNNIFIPKKINVGFQNRNDTYTKKLAYIIYFDQNDKLRKEKSWNSWRDENIPSVIYDNVPISGFVLNKKVGDYDSGWSHRHAYCRVYDPRNFEFEITIENLLYILENTSSIKGKGLEGEFVYGWDGKDLVLIPIDSPDYRKLEEFNNLMHNGSKFVGKDLIIGATYKSNNNQELIYLGNFYVSNEDNKESKAYFFYNKHGAYDWLKIKFYKSLSNNIIGLIDDKCVEDYADLIDELSKSSHYSERDQKQDEYVHYTLNEFRYIFSNAYSNYYYFFNEDNSKYFVKNEYYYGWHNNSVYKYEVYNKKEKILSGVSLDYIYEKFRPMYLVTYKSNGELIKEWKKK